MSSPLIVSLASYPPRIKTVSQCVRGLLNQSVLPDRILLWLYEGEFPNGRDDLPMDLLELENGILEVCWAPENLKPHNKYYWTFAANPDAIVVTVDDDLLYAPTMIEELLNWHNEFPEAVIANRTHMILLECDGTMAPYGDWLLEQDAVVGKPSHALLATNGAGSLFPAGVIPPALLDSEQIKKTSLHADDLWLKLLELEANIPVVATGHAGLTYIPGTQDCGLWLNVNMDGGNDKVLARMSDMLSEHAQALQEDFFLCCVSVFSKYRSYRANCKDSSVAKRLQHEAEEREVRLKGELDAERAEAKAKEDALRKEISKLRDKNEKKSEVINTLQLKNARYEERLKTPYLIRATLNVLRRIKRRFVH